MCLCRNYIHPSKAGLHAAAHANADLHLSTNEHQHDAASAVLRAALRTVVARCTASPSARNSVLNNLAQLNRLAPGSKREVYRDRLVPRRRGDIHPDLTAAVASMVLPCATATPCGDNTSTLNLTCITPPALQPDRSELSLTCDSSALTPGALSIKTKCGSACFAGGIAASGSSAAQIEHMRHCDMCSFAAKHFHGDDLSLGCGDSSDGATGTESVESPATDTPEANADSGDSTHSKDMFLSATDEPMHECEEDCDMGGAAVRQLATPALGCYARGNSKLAWGARKDSAGSRSSACGASRCPEGSLCCEEDLPPLNLLRAPSGPYLGSTGKATAGLKGGMLGTRSREASYMQGSLHAWSQSISGHSVSGRTSSQGSFQKMIQPDRTEAQRRWALLARHMRLMTLERELRRNMWMAAVRAAAQRAAQESAKHAERSRALEAPDSPDDRCEITRVMAPTQSSDSDVLPKDAALRAQLRLRIPARGALSNGTAAGPSCELPSPPSQPLEDRSVGATEGQPACRKLQVRGPVGGRSVPLATVGCRRLNVDVIGGLEGTQSSMLDDDCSGVLACASMMGGASVFG